MDRGPGWRAGALVRGPGGEQGRRLPKCPRGPSCGLGGLPGPGASGREGTEREGPGSSKDVLGEGVEHLESVCGQGHSRSWRACEQGRGVPSCRVFGGTTAGGCVCACPTAGERERVCVCVCVCRERIHS